MLIEGKNAVREALQSDITINKILVDKNFEHRANEIISLAHKLKIKVDFLPKHVLDKKSLTNHHQGFIAEATEFKYSSLNDLLENANSSNTAPLFVLLDGIEDPHNLGAIIRSCECAGVHGIVIPKNRACQINETVIRTSTGAIANVPVCMVTNLKEAVDFFKENNIWTFVAETGGENIYDKKLDMPIAVVIGSEGKGVKQSLRSYCDGIITLPLMGRVNSLNASVACAVVIFEILRQRKFKRKD